jgi:RNA polymerase sigma-70 factor (ECF subfamily)
VAENPQRDESQIAQQWLSESTTPLSQELIETCRTYLLLVANRRMDPQLQGKFGPSDLVQETFLHAQRNFDQFRGQTQDELLAWLRKILLHHLIDERRRFRDATKREVGREQPLDPSSASEATLQPLASDPSPSAQASVEEETRAMLVMLKRLPDEYREVIRLRNWERLGFPEIGQRMNRTADAARKLWTRAIERLQQELDG